jgi:glycerol transport system ATP-binding protein
MLGGGGAGMLSFPGVVSVTELSASESFVHVDVGFGTWVCLVRGVHDWQPGAPAEVSVDMHRAFVFDMSDNLAASPAMAASA